MGLSQSATRLRSLGLLLGLCLMLMLAALAYWPVDFFEIRVAEAGGGSPDGAAERFPSLLGRDVTTSIIHSVQLTPVIETYRVQEGRIWERRVKIMSHNAGLPSLRPERGRFLYDSPWIIIEGGGRFWEEIPYRVGTEQLGKNEICVFNQPCRKLWRETPGKRLVFRAIPMRALFS